MYEENKDVLGKYFDLKRDVYTMVNEQTKKTPHLRSGWKITTEV